MIYKLFIKYLEQKNEFVIEDLIFVAYIYSHNQKF